MDTEGKAVPLFTHILPVAENIVRVVHTPQREPSWQSNLLTADFKADILVSQNLYERGEDNIRYKNKRGETVLKESGHSLAEKAVYKYVVDGEPVMKYKQTANGEVAYIENARRTPAGTAFEGKLVFDITGDERVYGLGQHEDGVYNYNGKTEYLYQTNMKISVPFIISSKNYGLLIDTETAAIFDGSGGKLTFTLDTVNEISYYVITGERFDEIIVALRTLTGSVPMLPRWAYGYIQSKERYRSSDELLETAAKFRQSGIPIDCIVQDWLSWEEGLWGEKRADKKRYPNIKELADKLHERHVRLMVSIWPNMAEGGSNHFEFKEKGMLLPNCAVYNAFDEEARAVYWKQCDEDWFSAGIDAWWCDNAEPFSDADWNGAVKRPEALRYRLILEDSKKSMDWTRLNTYGLLHAKGIYDHWRATGNEKRVVNLTRSSYISGQKYGVIAWSGDVSAKWSTLRNQVTEGIKFSMSGMPYWTLDIGGFFTVKDQWENRGCGKAGDNAPLWFWNGDYNDGASDPGYRELYVRWLQYGAFLPMFRAHGTDTPREPWAFGKPGEVFYDVIVKFIHLRYRLLPYIYSIAAAVSQSHETMMRSLMFDFADDENVWDISDSYMFGKSLLVCPVTGPMYYGPNGVPLKDTDKIRAVYLPKAAGWYDFWTNEKYSGGQTLQYDAPLDKMPLFVKAGSILPMSEPLMYADERNGAVSEIVVYAGADGDFTLYNDEGDNYSYENGHYCAIRLTYRDSDKTLTFGKACGQYKYQNRFAVRLVGGNRFMEAVTFPYEGEETVIQLA